MDDFFLLVFITAGVWEYILSFVEYNEKFQSWEKKARGSKAVQFEQGSVCVCVCDFEISNVAWLGEHYKFQLQIGNEDILETQER